MISDLPTIYLKSAEDLLLTTKKMPEDFMLEKTNVQILKNRYYILNNKMSEIDRDLCTFSFTGWEGGQLLYNNSGATSNYILIYFLTAIKSRTFSK